MIIYEEFLNAFGVISESEFDSVVNSFSIELDITCLDSIYFSIEECDSDNLARCIITHLIYNCAKYAYVDDIDFDNKTVSIGDIKNLEELEKVKDILKGWTISNYQDIINSIQENEKIEKENKEFDSLIETIKYSASLNQLKEFVKTL